MGKLLRVLDELEADIIATPENPLENIQALRNVHFVMKDGKVVRHSK